MNAHAPHADFIVPAAPRNVAWIGVGLDGVLAHTLSASSTVSIGRAIPKMVDQVKEWVAQGRLIKVFTARVAGNTDAADTARQDIAEWLVRHGLPPLECTCVRDAFCIELWDANVVQTVPNTGSRIDNRR